MIAFNNHTRPTSCPHTLNQFWMPKHRPRKKVWSVKNLIMLEWKSVWFSNVWQAKCLDEFNLFNYQTQSVEFDYRTCNWLCQASNEIYQFCNIKRLWCRTKIILTYHLQSHKCQHRILLHQRKLIRPVKEQMQITLRHLTSLSHDLQNRLKFNYIWAHNNKFWSVPP